MEKFIDIHCHILPGVDDGAQDMDRAIEMLRMAWQDGTGAMVLTPHYRGRYRQNTPQLLEEVFAALRQRAPEQMELYLGNEAGHQPDLTDKLAEGEVLPMNGGACVLLEFCLDTTCVQALDAVAELLSNGSRPIIAHVERYPLFLRDRMLVEQVLDMGALIQVNADSVMGGNGFTVKRFCHWLLKGRRAHFIASDSHDTLLRPPKLMDCFRYIEKKYGGAYAAALFWENARAVLAEDT